jgi:L-asparagine oxygenase
MEIAMNTEITMKFIELSHEEKLTISDAISGLTYSPEGKIEYIKAIRKRMWSVLPEHIIDALEGLKNPFPEYAGIKITNLPIDSIITGSPHNDETGRLFKNGCLTENLLVGMGSILGEPYSIAHEGYELVNNLTPHKEKASDFTGLGSAVELDFHIENAAQVYQDEGDTSPFVLMLLGVREDTQAKPLTRISDARKALKLLSAEDIEVLREASFIIKVPHRWRSATVTPKDNTGLVPVVSGPLNAPRITVAFYPDMVIPVNSRALDALNKLHTAIQDVAESIHITPGTMVIINNNFMLHSRDKFEANYDENERAYRWVQRIFVTKSLWPFRNFCSQGERIYNAKLLTADQ